MALQKRGEWWYGDSHADIRDEILRFSELVGYRAAHYADAVCTCGSKIFLLRLDENEGVASRACTLCNSEAHPIGDSADYLEDAEQSECACPCGKEEFEITIGVSLYADSEDVKWLYLGCRCSVCGLTAVYGNWKNVFNGYRELLSRV